jgi:hypothetical protein
MEDRRRRERRRSRHERDDVWAVSDYQDWPEWLESVRAALPGTAADQQTVRGLAHASSVI